MPWLFTIAKKQKGMLEKVKDFMPASGNLAAYEALVPIDQDLKKVVANAKQLASSTIRSFEIMWNKKNKDLRFQLTSDVNDIEHYVQAFKMMYPNAEFRKLDDTVPEWFHKDAGYSIFDASTRHGHFFAVFDKDKEPKLVSQLAGAVQLAEFAWIQIVFVQQDASSELSKLLQKTQLLYNRVTDSRARPRTRRKSDGSEERYYLPDYEKGRDFERHFGLLHAHASRKANGTQVIASLRGIVLPDVNIAMDAVQTLQVENVQAQAIDKLEKYSYDYARFYTDTGKPKKNFVKIGKEKTEDQRIVLFTKRLLPKARYLRDVVSRYCSPRGMSFMLSFLTFFSDFNYRAYHTRKPLPFLLLGTEEMHLFVHLPDCTTPNVKVTRGQSMPDVTTPKDLFPLGTKV